MMRSTKVRWLILGAALVSMTGAAKFARAAATFPQIPVWAYAGAYQDVAHTVHPYTTICAGLTPAQLADSVRDVPRSVTVRFLRDRVAEARPDFGGYRIYRVTNDPDSTRMQLLRRYSVQMTGPVPIPSLDGLQWWMSRVNPATLQFECGGAVVHDSVATFLDPDSTGRYVKVCPSLDLRTNRCITDSVFRIIAPPGPHDGFVTYYSVTYELLNIGFEGTYEDMFVPDLLGTIRPCTDPLDPRTCANLNHKLRNLSNGVVPSGGPRPNLERVLVVPNPYRASEEWNVGGRNDLHFINLPTRARISIYTLSGDLVRRLDHDARPRGSDITSVLDFERWNLKNAGGQEVASGIYMFRVESDAFAYQGRFVVIR